MLSGPNGALVGTESYGVPCMMCAYNPNTQEAEAEAEAEGSPKV